MATASSGQIFVAVIAVIILGVCCGQTPMPCPSGYELESSLCVDIDECSSGSNPCHAEATCENRNGSYACYCNATFEGDGVTNCAPEPTVAPSASSVSSLSTMYIIYVCIVAAVLLIIANTGFYCSLARPATESSKSYTNWRFYHPELHVNGETIAVRIEQIFNGSRVQSGRLHESYKFMGVRPTVLSSEVLSHQNSAPVVGANDGHAQLQTAETVFLEHGESMPSFAARQTRAASDSDVLALGSSFSCAAGAGGMLHTRANSLHHNSLTPPAEHNLLLHHSPSLRREPLSMNSSIAPLSPCSTPFLDTNSPVWHTNGGFRRAASFQSGSATAASHLGSIQTYSMFEKRGSCRSVGAQAAVLNGDVPRRSSFPTNVIGTSTQEFEELDAGSYACAYDVDLNPSPRVSRRLQAWE